MTTLQLKNIPDDVKQYMLKIQGEIKQEKKVGQFSLDLTVYHILRDHKKMKEKT